MRSILSEYKIDRIDLYKNGIPEPLVSVHPNDKGCSLVADRICEYMKTK